MLNGRIIRYTQDDFPTYGNQIRVFEITKLTAADYEEEEMNESPILKKSGTGWNGFGMHHIDPHKINEENWIAVVDGYSGRCISAILILNLNLANDSCIGSFIKQIQNVYRRDREN
ncbi:MAG: hypothetical protein LWX54_11500 [Deltaproteobacteria bacterium]|nr:hypothetical protein [Deltaproteobacteria bacterium]